MDYTVIKCEDSSYPKRLLQIKDYPKELYVMGNIDLLNKDSIAIVGARDCNIYGIEQTKRFASFLSQNDICIVSGLAKGIDSIAHQYSMDKMGKTIAVIASGFNNIYPKENKALFDKILENGGLIVSEWEPDYKIFMRNFPRRNRIISGITMATLVVQSKYRSGSNITAHNAFKQNREVFCIPGNIDESRSIGSNNLIREGACVVLSPKDIIENLEYNNLIEKRNIKIMPEFKEVYEYMSNEFLSVNEIARKSKLSNKEVEKKLLMLEMDGFIERTDNDTYKVKEDLYE